VTRCFLALVVGAAACSDAPPAPPAPAESRAERLAVLERIAGECQVSPEMMELVGEDELRLRPSPSEPYERVECVLRRIDQLNLPAGKVGFAAETGNAAEANDAQAR
jgi:hypothetical protein